MNRFLKYTVVLVALLVVGFLYSNPGRADDKDALDLVIAQGEYEEWQDSIAYRITHLDPDSGGQLTGSCVTSSMDFGTSIASALSASKDSGGQPYTGWRVQQVTHYTGLHTALVLTSPEGNMYFVDNYFFGPSIQPVSTVDFGGKTAYLPNTGQQYTSPGTLLLPGEWLPTSKGIDYTIEGDTYVTTPNPMAGITAGSGIPQRKKEITVGPTQSVDPNQKSGPYGYGEARYVKGDSPFTYTVAFENLSTAGAPAQTVVITDVLDDDLDLSTFRVGPISFGGHTLVPLSGEASYAGYYDLNSSIRVRVQVSVDESTRTATWTFSSLNPQTGEPLDPADASLGFLPPNQNPPEGQGYVTYFISPLSGASSGTVIVNQASIIFDSNDPIFTNTWSNTIDSEKPQSRATGGASTRAKPDGTLAVRWSGSDSGGSGIRSYDVFAQKKDDSAYSLWLHDATVTSAGFRGWEACTTYNFYTVATDNAGNTETVPSGPDLSTKVLPSGDIDGDGDVDNNDLNILLQDRNKTVANSACGIKCDLDCDGKITVLDGRVLATVCTRPKCATR